jgi:DnaJ-class molecular chaperone
MSYYALLGLSKTASFHDIEQAYRHLALIYHPDKPTADSVKFLAVSEAYDTLISKDKRRMYDNPQDSFEVPQETDFPFLCDFTLQKALEIFDDLF